MKWGPISSIIHHGSNEEECSEEAQHQEMHEDFLAEEEPEEVQAARAKKI